MRIEIVLSNGAHVCGDFESTGYSAIDIEDGRKLMLREIKKEGFITFGDGERLCLINADHIVEMKITSDAWLAYTGTETTELDFSKLFAIFDDKDSDEKDNDKVTSE